MSAEVAVGVCDSAVVSLLIALALELDLSCYIHFFVFAVGAALSRISKYDIAPMCPVLVSQQLYIRPKTA